MQELVVMDYSSDSLCFYKIPVSTIVDNKYLRFLGHKPSECSWIVSNFINIERYEVAK